MKDIPLFTTEYGAASLVLREIPYRDEAYITILDSLEPEKLIEECVGFCRACGAEKILARGNAWLEQFPLHGIIYEMRGQAWADENLVEHLWPVTEETADRFREIYNQKVMKIPNAAWMDSLEQNRMLSQGDGYFVHRDGKLLGIGRAAGEDILFLASCSPGAGADVVRALASIAREPRCVLDVASANEKALSLYERLGFLRVGEKSRWHIVR